MMRGSTWLVILAAMGLASDLAGQSVTRPLETIVAYPISGVTAHMSPDEARQALLGAGFSEKRGGEDWGRVPVGVFEKNGLQVAISHRDGQIVALSETRIASGDDFDYSADLERIKAHFALSGSDARACTEEPHGARCVVTDGVPRGAAFTATLTPLMIFITSARTRQRPD